MKCFQGIFTKKDGTLRKMVFTRIEDMPHEFVSSKILGTGTERKLPEGMQLVWDLEQEGWRTFNYNKIVKPVEEYDIDESDFLI